MNKQWIVAGLVFLLAGCGLSDKEKQTVTELTKDMQTHCIGRHLIDLPQGFEKVHGGASIFIPKGLSKEEDENREGFEITIYSVSVTSEKFKKEMEARRLKLLESSYNPRLNALKETSAVGENATLFRILEIDDAYQSELHFLVNDVHVKVIQHSYANTFAAVEKDLLAFSKKIEIAKPANEPQSGFCLGPVVIKGDYVREYSKFFYRDKQRPDVTIGMDVDTYTKDESESLLDRVSGKDNLLSLFGVSYSVLRKGDTTMAGMKAQEWLMATDGAGEDGKGRQHKLIAENQRTEPSPLQPSLHLTLETGQQDPDGQRYPSSLSDKEVVALWDVILRSVRPRAGAI